MKRLLPVLLVLGMVAMAAVWGTQNGKTVGSATGNLSKENGITIGTATGNYNAWNGLSSPSGSVTWTVPHTTGGDSTKTGNLSCSAAVCTLTISSTTAGNAGVVLVADTSGNGTTLSSVSGGGTWTVSSGGYLSNACCGDIAAAYILSLTGGATSLTITMSATVSLRAAFWEVHRSTGTAALDVAGTHLDNVSGTARTGPTLTLTGTNDFITAAFSLSTGQMSSCTAPYNGAFIDMDQSMAISFFGGGGALGGTTTPGTCTSTATATAVSNSLALK